MDKIGQTFAWILHQTMLSGLAPGHRLLRIDSANLGNHLPIALSALTFSTAYDKMTRMIEYGAFITKAVHAASCRNRKGIGRLIRASKGKFKCRAIVELSIDLRHQRKYALALRLLSAARKYAADEYFELKRIQRLENYFRCLQDGSKCK